MRSIRVLSGVFAAVALIAPLRAAEVGIQIGPEPVEKVATRGYAGWNVTPWFTLQAGALVVHQGVIPDVTPVFHTTGPLFGEIGVGFGDNRIDNGRQINGAIFHDIVGLGYVMTQRSSALVNVQHWSNGWPHNPVFGFAPNGGYTALTLGIAYRF